MTKRSLFGLNYQIGGIFPEGIGVGDAEGGGFVGILDEEIGVDGLWGDEFCLFAIYIELLELANIHLRELRVIEVVKVGLLLEDTLDETQVVEHGLGTHDEISRVAALPLRIRRFLLQIACLGFIFFIYVRGVDTRSGRAYQGLSFRDRGSRRVLLLRKGIYNSLRRSLRGLLAGCQKCHCRKKCK